jgi:hypothetical protein
MSESTQLRLAEARAAVESASLPPSAWAVGKFQDDRPCLVLDGGEWVAGYFERGRFDRRFTEVDTGVAVARFVAWVRSIVESTEASSAATAEWLRRMGKERP